MNTNEQQQQQQPLNLDEFEEVTEIINRDLSSLDTHEITVEGKKIVNCVFKKNNLEDASFIDGTELSKCTFEECQFVHTVFSDTHLTDVNFNGCNLNDVFFDPNTITALRRVHFPSAHITDITLDGCNLAESKFTEANLTNVNLTNAVLNGANFHGAILENVILSGAQLKGADFGESTFVETILPEQADLTDVSFEDVDARDLDFSGKKLVNANFTNANLRSVPFRGANLNGARFTDGTMLDGANFAEATFVGTHFDSADLSGLCLAGLNFREAVFVGQVNFSEANLSKSRFEKCALNGSLFANADLTDTIFDDCTFNGACFDEAKLSGASFIHCTFDNAQQEMGAVSSFSNTIVDDKVVVLECIFKEEPLELADAIKRGNSAYAGMRFDDPKNFKVRLFAGKDFTGTSFVGLSLKDVCFAESILTKTRFENCDLSGAYFCAKSSTTTFQRASNFMETVFSNCKMDGAVLAGVVKGFNGTTFEKCSGMGTIKLSGSSLAGATFHDVKFSANNLADSNLQGATLGKISFAGMDLSAVALRGVHVDGPLDFTGTKLKNADFSGNNFGESKFTKAVLDSVSFEDCDLTHTDFCSVTLTSVSFNKARFPEPEKFAGFKASGAMSFAGATLPSLRFQCPSMRGFVFSNTVLSGVVFDGCDTTEADFTNAVFEGVSFSGSQLGKKGDAYLSGFTLRSKNNIPCNFSKCHLTGVDFSGMDLTGHNFVGATLERVRFDKCILTSADFENAVFPVGNVSLVGVQLSKVSFRGSRLNSLCLNGLRIERDVIFTGATLVAPKNFRDLVCPKGLDLSGTNITNADFGGRSLAGFSFRGATLKDVKLCKCDLSNVDFENAIFQGRVELADVKSIQTIAAKTDFSGAVVCGATFSDVCLHDVKFTKASFLDGTTFAGASLISCTFDGCDLMDVDFTGAVLASCSLVDARLSKALVDTQKRSAQLVKRYLRNKRVYDGRRLDLSVDPFSSAPQLRSIPDDVWHGIPIIESLDISGNDIRFLVVPRGKSRIEKTLRSINLRDNKRFVFSKGSIPFQNIHTLDISGTAASSDMSAIRDLAALKSLTATHLALRSIDTAACLPPSLTALDISDNALSGVDFRNLPHLQSLSIARNSLTSLPILHNNGEMLTTLNVSDNSTLAITDGNFFVRFTSLTSLSIRNTLLNCPVLSLPRTLTSLDATGVKSQNSNVVIDLATTPTLVALRMRGAQITLKNFNAVGATLTTFEASVDQATSFFLRDLTSFNHLSYLSLSGPCIAPDAPPFDLPEGIWGIPSLCSLSLTMFGIREIPERLVALPVLQELNLERNAINNVPEYISDFKSLRVLYIGGNPCSENYDIRNNVNFAVITHLMK